MLSRPVLLFDGECGFCRTWISRLRRADRRNAIETIPYQERHGRSDLPSIPEAALQRAMHLVLPDGRVFAGGRAVGPVLELLGPPWSGGRWLLKIPGVQSVVDRGYDWVARRRHRLGCGGAACSWKPAE